MRLCGAAFLRCVSAISTYRQTTVAKQSYATIADRDRVELAAPGLWSRLETQSHISVYCSTTVPDPVAAAFGHGGSGTPDLDTRDERL